MVLNRHGFVNSIMIYINRSFFPKLNQASPSLWDSPLPLRPPGCTRAGSSGYNEFTPFLCLHNSNFSQVTGCIQLPQDNFTVICRIQRGYLMTHILCTIPGLWVKMMNMMGYHSISRLLINWQWVHLKGYCPGWAWLSQMSSSNKAKYYRSSSGWPGRKHTLRWLCKEPQETLVL